MARQRQDKGFSVIELLMVMAVVSVLVATAVPTFKGLSRQAYDLTAQSDYRNLKLAIYNALADPSTPSTFVMSRQRGPKTLAAPLNAVSLSANTQVNVSCTTVRAAGRTPTVSIRMDVESLGGANSYRYTELNGLITEQVVKKP